MTSQEWADALVRGPEQELQEFKRRVSYVRRQAYYEGLTAHLRPGKGGTPFHECPFCSAEELNLHNHLITCNDVPEELREPL